MKILKVGLVADVNTESGYEAIERLISEPEFMEICTPVLFGNLSKATQVLKKIQLEQPFAFNSIKNAYEAVDGHANIVDGFETEEDALAAAINAYMSNNIDVLVIAPENIVNTSDKHDLSDFIAKSIEAEQKDVFDWVVNGNLRTLELHPIDKNHDMAEGLAVEAFMNDLMAINKSLRKDYMLIKPRIAVVSSIATLHKDLAELREHGVFAFGPFSSKSFAEESYSHYDAVLFLEDDKACESILSKQDNASTFGYISGLPMVVTYLTKNADGAYQGMKDALYSAIDILRARISYKRATYNPLEKQWVPRGRDDFKLDLTKEEAE